MKPRERVLKTLRFEQVDRVAYDLMEGAVWPELMAYFESEHGLGNEDDVRDFLGTDFRWIYMDYQGPSEEQGASPDERKTYSREVMKGPLFEAKTIADVESFGFPDPSWWRPPDFENARRRWPDHALAFSAGWNPLFWSACLAFGMEGALTRMLTAPKLFDAFVRKQHEFYLDVLTRGVKAARGFCDICWLGDDYASQKALLMDPELWRRHIKPYLAEHVRVARENDMYVLFHSCGAVRSILPDLIDIGVNALLVFQTSARGMEVESIASEFGGRLAFYGGVDVQQLLSYGTLDEVEKQVRANVRAFEDCGGYIVANSHLGVLTIKGENILRMCETARKCTLPLDK